MKKNSKKILIVSGLKPGSWSQDMKEKIQEKNDSVNITTLDPFGEKTKHNLEEKTQEIREKLKGVYDFVIGHSAGAYSLLLLQNEIKNNTMFFLIAPFSGTRYLSSTGRKIMNECVADFEKRDFDEPQKPHNSVVVIGDEEDELTKLPKTWDTTKISSNSELKHHSSVKKEDGLTSFLARKIE